MEHRKFFKSEKNHVFKKMSREFNFKVFSGLILIRISIALQLIATWYKKRKKIAKINIFELWSSTFDGFFDVFCWKIDSSQI